MDSKQAWVFCLMAAIILVLTGIMLFREINTNRDSGIALVDVSAYSNYAVEDRVDSISTNQEESTKKEPARIKVYITGQVRNPGVIELDEGSRLEDAVKLAGGLLEDADITRINLALRVKDEGMYVIPKEGEPLSEEYSIADIQKDDDGRVNINIADQSELETLPRIGPALARRIIEYREKNGPFKKIEDIKNVSGIGEKTFDGLKDLIKVE